MVAGMQAEQALRESVELYRALFESMDQAYCVFEMLYDAVGHPVDYRFLRVNAAFVRMTGWTDVVGRRMLELAPDHEPHWFEIYGKVALTGEPIRFTERAKASSARWFDLFAFRLGASDSRTVAVHFSAVTEQKHDQEALTIARAELGEIIEWRRRSCACCAVRTSFSK